MQALIPCENLHFTIHRYRPDMSAVRVEGYNEPEFSDAQYAYYSEHAREHPISRHFLDTGSHAAVRVSDLMPTREWIATEFWETTLAWLNYRYSMLALHSLGKNVLFVFNCNRCTRDFTEHEKHILNAVAPFVGNQYQHLSRLEGCKKRLAKHARPKSPPSAAETLDLTPREREVFRWLGEGKTNREIGKILGISHRTVGKHLENILNKLQLENRYAAASLAAGYSIS
ncbi:MAG: helix-turn-helix transcriptional regulator [Verrucomicrobia bacterium]|nr:helix-turn-helix transcriptional regulator [Verrucomicrobiota bacterium]